MCPNEKKKNVALYLLGITCSTNTWRLYHSCFIFPYFQGHHEVHHLFHWTTQHPVHTSRIERL